LTTLSEDRLLNGPNDVNGWEADDMMAGSRRTLRCRMGFIVRVSKSLGVLGPIKVVVRAIPPEILI
jgi:hypothetical protein